MILALIFLWEGSTKTFQLPCGMLTPILFGVAAITSLSPLGETYNPTLPTDIIFNFDNPAFKQYSLDHHDKGSLRPKAYSFPNSLAFVLPILFRYTGGSQRIHQFSNL